MLFLHVEKVFLHIEKIIYFAVKQLIKFAQS